SSRMPGSRNHPECGITPPDTSILYHLLPRFPLSSIARQGFTGNQRSSATRQGHRRRDSEGRRASSSLRTTRSLNTCLFSHLSTGVTLGIDVRSLSIDAQSLASCRCILEHILANPGIPVAASDSPACAESCSDRIIGIETWRTFLENHVKQLVSVDFFVVPTVSFRILYVFLVLSHERRRVVHFNVTEHPTAEWTAAQLMQAFPWDTAPRYLLRDRDRVYGEAFRTLAAEMEITEVLTAPRSPWQSPYVERLIGSIRRECLDHVVVMNESSLRREMACYLDYYHGSRSHLSLGKDSPDGRAVEPPERGRIVAVPKVGGLHHRYERRAV